jgi:hypothetical protein
MHMPLYRNVHDTNINWISLSQNTLLHPSYGTTAYSRTLASHLLLHVCHKLKRRKYLLKVNGAWCTVEDKTTYQY